MMILSDFLRYLWRDTNAAAAHRGLTGDWTKTLLGRR